MAKTKLDEQGAKELANKMVKQKEFNEMTEKDRGRVRRWIEHVALGMELSFE